MADDVVTLTITLPLNGTALDYAQAISHAMTVQPDWCAKTALSSLLQHVHVPQLMNYTEGRSTLVFGKMS